MNKEADKHYLSTLLREKVIDEENFRLATYEHNLTGDSGVKFLLLEGYLDTECWFDFCFEHWNLNKYNPEKQSIDNDFTKQFEFHELSKLDFLPISYKDNECIVLTPYPWLNEHVHYLRERLNFNVQICTLLTSYTKFISLQRRFTEQLGNLTDLVDDISVHPQCLREQYSKMDHPVVRLVTAIIEDALENNASDVHFDPCGYETTVRYRIDGVLRHRICIHSHLWQAVSIRFKVLANIDITEKRFPQEGSFVAALTQQVDIRLSVVPGMNGEHFVLRFLRKETCDILDNSGIGSKQIAMLSNIISQPYGMIIVAGPTGSGKSTTLYGMLQRLDNQKLNVITLEDPVEQRLVNVRQIQINEDSGLGFHKVLKSVLRQDPDVILIGEMRDEQTANLGVKASMTGHLVLTTVHADDTLGIYTRMQDLNVRKQLLEKQLKGLIAQRLLRRLCSHCKGASCPRCSGTGYDGRFAIMEIIDFSQSSAPQKHLNEIALESVSKGLTDLKEVERVLGNVSL